MTVGELSKICGLSPLALPMPDREISGCYMGDLLSWVMGRAEADNAWITIMTNQNVIAVASLADISAVILAEGVIPEEDIVTLAKNKGVNLLSSKAPAYETATLLFSVLK